MVDLSLDYLGLHLKNPLIAASSGLTASLKGVESAVNAGAGAVVLKSLFEEQLRAELAGIEREVESHPEAEAFLSGMGMSEGTSEYLDLVSSAKKAVDVPVFASINCTGGSWWVDFARKLESAGASGIELNIGKVPLNIEETSSQMEESLVATVTAVCKTVKIPVAVKIGSSYTNPGNILYRFGKSGARGAVLFNRFYRMDIDLDAMNLKAGPMRSSPEMYHESLRWIALLEGRVGLDLAASGGVYDGLAALRLVCAGAGAVQLCSSLYARGFEAIPQILEEMSDWMTSRKVAAISKLKGHLSRRNSENPELYGRLHYIKALVGQE